MKRSRLNFKVWRWLVAKPELGLRQWWWLPFAWMAVGVIFSFQPLLWGGLSGTNALRFESLRWWPWLIIAPAVIWLSLRLPLVGPRWPVALLTHLVFGIGISLGMNQLLPLDPFRGPRGFGGHWEHPAGRPDTHFNRNPSASPEPGKETPDFRREPNPGSVERGWPQPPGFDRPRPPLWPMRLRLTLPLYWSLVAMAHLLLFHLRTGRSARIETQLAEARLAALQMQLQPHFLFNSLNAISSLVRTQPDVADKMICALAALLRAALDAQACKEIRLGEELGLARQYLKIQRVRFGPQFDVVEDIGPDTLDVAVPPLVLQPLLENAITHGLGDRAGIITLRVRAQDGRLRMTISNHPAASGAAKPTAKPGSGIGLRNTRDRLAALYGDDAGVELREDGDSLVTEVVLPRRQTTAGSAA